MSFDYIFHGSPTIPVPASSPALGLDVTSNTMYVAGGSSWAAVTGGGAPSLAFGPVTVPLSNPKYPSAYAVNMASGNVDFYTVPANRLAIANDVVVTNPTGNSGPVTCLAQAKVSGTYHTFDFVAAGRATGSTGSVSMVPFLLHAGESFSLNNSIAGATAWANIIEFDATTNINDARLFSLSVGDNTLFTVPANKTVTLMGFPSGFQSPQTGYIYYWNNSGASRTIHMNAVPFGQSASANNTIYVPINPVTTQSQSSNQFYGNLNPGDFISINTDSAAATQTAWVIYTQQ